MKTELFDENIEGNPVPDIVDMVIAHRQLIVEFSPIPNDLTCKIKIGLVDILLSLDHLVEVVQALPEGFIEKAKT